MSGAPGGLGHPARCGASGAGAGPHRCSAAGSRGIWCLSFPEGPQGGKRRTPGLEMPCLSSHRDSRLILCPMGVTATGTWKLGTRQEGKCLFLLWLSQQRVNPRQPFGRRWQRPFCVTGRKRLSRRCHLGGRARSEDALPAPPPWKELFLPVPSSSPRCAHHPGHQPRKKGRKKRKKGRKERFGSCRLGAVAAEPGGDRCCCSVCPKTKEQKNTLGFPVCLRRDQTRCNFLVCLSSGESLGLRGCSPSLPAGHLPGQPGTAPGHPQDRWHELGTAFCGRFLSAPSPGGETEARRDLTHKSRAAEWGVHFLMLGIEDRLRLL